MSTLASQNKTCTLTTPVYVRTVLEGTGSKWPALMLEAWITCFLKGRFLYHCSISETFLVVYNICGLRMPKLAQWINTKSMSQTACDDDFNALLLTHLRYPSDTSTFQGFLALILTYLNHVYCTQMQQLTNKRYSFDQKWSSYVWIDP